MITVERDPDPVNMVLGFETKLKLKLKLNVGRSESEAPRVIEVKETDLLDVSFYL